MEQGTLKLCNVQWLATPVKNITRQVDQVALELGTAQSYITIIYTRGKPTVRSYLRDYENGAWVKWAESYHTTEEINEVLSNAEINFIPWE